MVERPEMKIKNAFNSLNHRKTTLLKKLWERRFIGSMPSV